MGRLPKQTIQLSVLARNQTKDSWTWNLAVPGSGTGRRMRVDDATQERGELVVGQETTGQLVAGDQERQLGVGHRRAERQAAEVGVEERRGSQHQTPEQRGEETRWGPVKKSLKMSDSSSIVEFSLVTHASVSPYLLLGTHMHVVLHTPLCSW